MNNESRNKIILLGLPETGKTSFLAALMHYIDAPIEGKNLNQYKYSSNTSYITSIVQSWLKGQKLDRTKITATKNSNTVAEIFLEETSTKEKFTLYIPDFFGETFETQFVGRVLEADYIELIKASSGILLFINPEKVNEPTLIEDLKKAYAFENLVNNLENEFSHNGMETDGAEENVDLIEDAKSDTDLEYAEPFNPEDSPTQLIIVDLLEAHTNFNYENKLNIAVIVSAWDVIKKDQAGLSPLKWLENALPMLYQYLQANYEKLIFKCFGISAQGGDIEDQEELKRLRSLHEPANRVIVQEDDINHNNIASPLEWLLQQWQKRKI